jgi:hypothetical protein
MIPGEIVEIDDALCGAYVRLKAGWIDPDLFGEALLMGDSAGMFTHYLHTCKQEGNRNPDNQLILLEPAMGFEPATC